jgi:arylsulfatase A-like enzyme
MRHLYARSIRYMDDWLGRLLERLDAAGVLDDTAVIVTSDHGENFGEGGLMAHAFSLDDRLIRVPLVASGPRTDRLAQTLTSLGRLPLLTADIAGITDHPWAADDLGPHGVAVAQLNPPSTPDHERVALVREEWGLDDAGVARLTTPFMGATDGRFKLIRRDGLEELVDLAADPMEVDPIPVAGAGAAVDAAAALPHLREALDHPSASGGFTLETAEEPRPEPADEETQAIEERMRLLGYM